MITEWKAGTEFYFESQRSYKQSGVKELTRIGRKYAYFGPSYNECRIEKATGLVGIGRGAHSHVIGRAHGDIVTYQEDQRKKDLWLSIRSYFTPKWVCPEHLSIEDLEDIDTVLRGERTCSGD